MTQPFQKVQRDIEPGGHDAGDRDGADQLDLPNHLRPRHLPAVQPPSILWRISGEKQARKLQATLEAAIRNYESLTYLLTGVKCRATSVAKKACDEISPVRYPN